MTRVIPADNARMRARRSAVSSALPRRSCVSPATAGGASAEGRASSSWIVGRPPYSLNVSGAFARTSRWNDRSWRGSRGNPGAWFVASWKTRAASITTDTASRRSERPSEGAVIREVTRRPGGTEQQRRLRQDLRVRAGPRDHGDFGEIGPSGRSGARVDEVVQSLAPRAPACATRRRAHVDEQDRFRAHADRPALSALAAPARVEIAAEVHEHVPAEIRREAIGEPALRDAAEIDRCTLSQARRSLAHLEYVRQRR